MPAGADVAGLSFAGDITAVNGDFSGTAFAGIAVGDAWNWSYMFEAGTADAMPDASLGIYDDPFVSSLITVGTGSTSDFGTQQGISVTDNHFFFNDSYTVDIFDVDNQLDFELFLGDPTQAALSSDGLPTQLNPGDFSTRTFRIFGPNGSSADGVILVPAPGALMVLGVGAIMGRGRRRS
ncbi:MAG: hypothetical protein K8E66_06915 [Phycisphaerales bacterium]|nr:hypothetical protein [Phycisphaerales bacterium]